MNLDSKTMVQVDSEYQEIHCTNSEDNRAVQSLYVVTFCSIAPSRTDISNQDTHSFLRLLASESASKLAVLIGVLSFLIPLQLIVISNPIEDHFVVVFESVSQQAGLLN